MIITREGLIAAAEGGACLQRIQMKVWEYMDLSKECRDGVKLANEIYEDVKATEEKIRGIESDPDEEGEVLALQSILKGRWDN